jgi:dTDP-4-dehydrorhamnose reductase
MKVLITGASGYVGARVYFELQSAFECIGTYHSQSLSSQFVALDITDKAQVTSVIKTHSPHVIMHIANNANAKWCDAHPDEAVTLNETATKYLVDSANDINARVIYISSFVAIEPFSLYSKTKANSEEHVKATKAGFTIVRPSLVIGYSPNTVNDRPFNRFLKNLDDNTQAVYDTSWKFQVTYLKHLSEVLKKVIIENISNEVIPVASAGLKSRYDVAKDILTPFNISVSPVNNNDPTPITTDSLETLRRLQLPEYTYESIIKEIIEEIKNRENYQLT